jgi:hypothetical protein
MLIRLTALPSRVVTLPNHVWALAFGLLALLAWDTSGLDLLSVRLAGDAHGFALREAWFTRVLVH